MNDAKVLETPRLLLRPFVPGDAETMFRRCTSRAECFRHLPWEPDTDPEQTRRRVESWRASESLHWAVEARDGGLIGYVNLHGLEPENGYAETTYFLSPEAWGRGYMTEALSAVLDHAFGGMGLWRVAADHFAGNDASGRVLERCGMRREGVARGRYWKAGQRFDSIQYGMTRPDWQTPASPYGGGGSPKG